VDVTAARRSLRNAWDQSQAVGRTLYEQLRLHEVTASNNLTGGAKSSVSGAGTSVGFTSGAGTFTAKDEADLWSYLVELFLSIQAALVAAGTAEPSDSVILAGMFSSIPTSGITESFCDHSEIRYSR